MWTVSGEYTFFLSDYAAENYEEFIAWRWELDSSLVDRDRALPVREILEQSQDQPSF